MSATNNSNITNNVTYKSEFTVATIETTINFYWGSAFAKKNPCMIVSTDVDTDSEVFTADKIKSTLEDLRAILEKNRKVVLAREMTKIHEEFIRGNIDTIIERADNLKGEMVLIIEGNLEKKENELNNLSLDEHYNYYKEQGFSKKDIIKKIAKDRNVNKNEIYKQFINKEED